jgi:hypothetical protein
MAAPIQTISSPPLKIKINVPSKPQHELFGNQTIDNGRVSFHEFEVIKRMEENERVFQFARGAAYCCVGEGTGKERG